jgi:hypothetical protein
LASNSTYAQKKDAPEKKVPEKKAAPDKLLAGKIFTIEITVTGGKKAAEPEKDEISFKSDKFTSNLMKKESQFMPSAYTPTLDPSNAAGAVINFESEMKNADDETLKWTGTINGDDIEGTAVLTNKKGKVKKEYSFSGSKKGLKKKKEKEVE